MLETPEPQRPWVGPAGTDEVDAVLEAAYRAHRPMLYRALLRMTRDAGDAEELVQEAFIRLMTELRAGRVPDRFDAWLFRVAGNLAHSRGRRLAVRTRPRAYVPDPEVTQPDELVLRRERLGALETAMASLPPPRRDAMVLAA